MMRAALAGSRFRRHSHGAYTLMEMLVALIMFALISGATAFLMTGAVRARYQLDVRSIEAQEARALINVLTRDLRGAFAVSGSPSTYFVASGADSGPVLQFTTLASRIAPDPATVSGLLSEDAVYPQSDVLQVTYDYDPTTHVLSRLVSRLPGVETLPASGNPDYILSRRVALVSFAFVDASGNTRTEWNLQTPQTDETGQQVNASAYDTALPTRIGVELELDRPSGDTAVLTTTVVPANTAVQPAGQKPAQTAPQQGSGGSGGPQGGAGGGGATP